MKTALAAALTALATLAAAASVQIWQTEFMLERELRAKIDSKVSGGDFAVVES